jgi:hypothetical protein
MQKCGCCVGVVQSADGVVADTSHGGGNFRNKKRGHNYRVASFLNRSKNLKALSMAAFVRIECIHEHASVYGVSETSRVRPSTRTPASGGGHP